MTSKTRFEAKGWLQESKNSSAFAGNAFGKTQEALEYVDALYAFGALRVEVTELYDEEWRIKSEGGAYAATFLVTLPEDELEKYKLLYNIANLHPRPDEMSEKAGGMVRLWWD